MDNKPNRVPPDEAPESAQTTVRFDPDLKQRLADHITRLSLGKPFKERPKYDKVIQDAVRYWLDIGGRVSDDVNKSVIVLDKNAKLELQSGGHTRLFVLLADVIKTGGPDELAILGSLLTLWSAHPTESGTPEVKAKEASRLSAKALKLARRIRRSTDRNRSGRQSMADGSDSATEKAV